MSKSIFSNRTPPVAVSEKSAIVNPITLQRTFFTQVTGNRIIMQETCVKNTSSKQQNGSIIPTITATDLGFWGVRNKGTGELGFRGGGGGERSAFRAICNLKPAYGNIKGS